MRTVLLTALALVGFAANSLLCRASLAGGERLIDAATFTLLRLYSGMLMLLLLLRVRGRKPQGGSRVGSWLQLVVRGRGEGAAMMHGERPLPRAP